MPVAATATTIRNAVTSARCTEFTRDRTVLMAGSGQIHAESIEPGAQDAQALIDFMPNDEWDLLLATVNRRIEAMEALPDGALKTSVFDLLQGIDAIHRESLRRLVRLFKQGVLEKVVSDPAIHTLMELYDLLPPEPQQDPPGETRHRFPTIPIQLASTQPGPAVRYPHWVPALQADDPLAPGAMRELLVDGLPVLLVCQADQLFALASRCEQDGASLQGGTLSGYTLTCPNHAGCYYDVRQGIRIGHGGSIECYPVKQDEGGRVLVGLDMDFTPRLPSF
jgi:nitrite reductase/ring-hydroxylating ferredoxin subunit